MTDDSDTRRNDTKGGYTEGDNTKGMYVQTVQRHSN
jgi:hypothetical protein